jgi:hypothetical protein
MGRTDVMLVSGVLVLVMFLVEVMKGGSMGRGAGLDAGHGPRSSKLFLPSTWDFAPLEKLNLPG